MFPLAFPVISTLIVSRVREDVHQRRRVISTAIYKTLLDSILLTTHYLMAIQRTNTPLSISRSSWHVQMRRFLHDRIPSQRSFTAAILFRTVLVPASESSGTICPSRQSASFSPYNSNLNFYCCYRRRSKQPEYYREALCSERVKADLLIAEMIIDSEEYRVYKCDMAAGMLKLPSCD